MDKLSDEDLRAMLVWCADRVSEQAKLGTIERFADSRGYELMARLADTVREVSARAAQRPFVTFTWYRGTEEL